MSEASDSNGAYPAETFLGLDTYGLVAVSFLIFAVILWRLGAFGAVARALDARADKVRADLAEAAALKAEAQALRDRAAADAAQAEVDARAVIENAGNEARRIVEQAAIEAEESIARRTRLAEDRIAAEARNAEAELRARASELTIAASREILGQRAARGELAALTDAAIAGMDRH